MESLLVLLFFKLRYVTQSRCCKRVMRCFGASSVHTIIMPEAHRSVYFVITAQCNSVWCSVEYFGYKCSHCRSVLVYQCHGCLCTIPLHHCSVPVPLQCVCHCQLYKLQCGCHCQCLCIVPVWLWVPVIQIAVRSLVFSANVPVCQYASVQCASVQCAVGSVQCAVQCSVVHTMH